MINLEHLRTKGIVIDAIRPGDFETEVRRRLQYHFRSGAKLVWTTVPTLQEVKICRRDGSEEYLRAPATLSGEDVLPGFVLSVEDLLSAVDPQGAANSD